MTIDQFLDLLKDQRSPWFLPRWLLNPSHQHAPERSVKRARIALTFDVEENYPDRSHDNLISTINKIRKLLLKHKAKATFFIQGSLVTSLAPILKGLIREGHELGIHGYHHNNWGEAVWFWSDPPLLLPQKRADLMTCLAAFQSQNLPPPKLFRAPNMNINSETLKLLQEFGFVIDSSWPSFRQSGALKKVLGRLQEIPVTSLPAGLSIRKGIPSFNFTVFNLATVLTMKQQQISSYIKAVAAVQETGQPELVFLSHPWEYYPNKVFPYCQAENFAQLEDFLTFLKKNDAGQFVILSTLTNRK